MTMTRRIDKLAEVLVFGEEEHLVPVFRSSGRCEDKFLMREGLSRIRHGRSLGGAFGFKGEVVEKCKEKRP